MLDKKNQNANDVQTTFYCDHTHPDIEKLAEQLENDATDSINFLKKTFFFVRDNIHFGIDRWQRKASITLSKGYGACFNKNLLMMAILRNRSIPCQLMAHPMKNSFVKPAAGNAFKTLSTPFYHCFTQVFVDQKWINLDPTLDTATFNAFFKPLQLGWSIDWDENGMDPLYSESIIGPPETFHDIDAALKRNLNSYYLFKYEPNFILNLYEKAANQTMKKRMIP